MEGSSWQQYILPLSEPCSVTLEVQKSFVWYLVLMDSCYVLGAAQFK